MKKYILQSACLFFLILFTWGVAGAAESDLSATGGIKINADSIGYDKKTDSYVATGKVRIDWSGMILFADSVSLRQSDNLATAEGNILVRKNDDTLTGDRAVINLETEQGEIANGRLFIKQGNFHLSGDKLMKTGTEDYRVEDGFFTTCDGETPSWKFGVSELDVTRGAYARGKHAVFYIKNVPVLYFPYIVYPVKEERQSGFLIPRIGQSSKKGFTLDIPYYYVISPSQDATFTLHAQTRRGVGLGADYRYLLRNSSSGNAGSYLIYDLLKDKMRGTLNLLHRQEISSSLFAMADIKFVLDRDFYRDFGEETGEYNKRYLESSAFVTKHWERYAMTAELRYTQDLLAESNKATLQKLPVINATGIKQQILETPLYFSFDSNFTNFYRREGLQGQRFDLHPALTYYTSPGGIMEGAAWVGYLQRIYNTYGGSQANGFDSIAAFNVGASLSSTFSRLYDVDWGNLTKVKHTIIPEISYSFFSHDENITSPFFDYEDRLVNQNMIGYSITNYLTGKYLSPDGTPLYRDLAYLRISQGYEFSGIRRDILTLADEQKAFTDIRLEARLNLNDYVTFNLDSRFNPYHFNFTTANVSTEVSDKNGNLAGIGYRFTRDQVRYLEGKLDLGYFDPFVFHYLTRYSIDKNDFLESYYALELKQQCWGIMFSYRDRPGDQSFLISFTLSGLGTIGKAKAY